MLELARSMEAESIKDYNDWALECGNHADAAFIGHGGSQSG